MNRGLQFGTVLRLDPKQNLLLPQPDPRRWMIISFDDRLKWTLLYIGPAEAAEIGMTDPSVSHFVSLLGFEAVDE